MTSTPDNGTPHLGGDTGEPSFEGLKVPAANPAVTLAATNLRLFLEAAKWTHWQIDKPPLDALRIFAANNYHYAQALLAEVLCEAGDLDGAMLWARQGAAAADPAACELLSSLVLLKAKQEGNGSPEVAKEALLWLRRAALIGQQMGRQTVQRTHVLALTALLSDADVAAVYAMQIAPDRLN